MMSRTWYVIMYVNGPIVLWFKPQIEITLSKTENEYDTVYQSLRDTNPLLDILLKLKKVILSEDNTPKVHWSIFEDRLHRHGEITQNETENEIYSAEVSSI